MRIASAIVALVTALTVAGSARAETVSTRLTPKKTGDHLWSFAVTVERQKEGAGEFLQFRVTAKPTNAGNVAPLPHRCGTLSVFAGKEFVSSCEVRPTERDGELSFSFRVAAKYAEKSTFIFAETPDHEAERGGFYYWFYLKDFADAPAEPAP